MPKPENFPGVNGGPAVGAPPFLCLDGLPVEWHHLVSLSKPLARAIHHAAAIPHADGPVAATQWQQIALAKKAAQNVVTTIERIEAWSRQNLEPKPEPETSPPTRSRKP